MRDPADVRTARRRLTTPTVRFLVPIRSACLPGSPPLIVDVRQGRGVYVRNTRVAEMFDAVRAMLSERDRPGSDEPDEKVA